MTWQSHGESGHRGEVNLLAFGPGVRPETHGSTGCSPQNTALLHTFFGLFAAGDIGRIPKNSRLFRQRARRRGSGYDGRVNAPAAIDSAALLCWYAANGRHTLPWRASADPYAVLVSEVMLQQTQVDRVLPKYQQFMAAFSTFAALAAAPLAEVIRCWQGLGYNRRVVHLHRIARAAVERGGVLPADPAELRRLPGIGVYTAAAIASFAYERDVAVVDTNIRRVLGRALLGDGAPTDATARRLAGPLLPPGRGRDWNLALMDLGATVCTARAPACPACPLAAGCAWNGVPPLRITERGPGGEVALRETRAPYRPAQPFVGSRRYYRGRIVDALRPLPSGATLPLAALGPAIRPDYGDALQPWLTDLLAALAREGLVTEDEQGVQLP